LTGSGNPAGGSAQSLLADPAQAPEASRIVESSFPIGAIP